MRESKIEVEEISGSGRENINANIERWREEDQLVTEGGELITGRNERNR